MRKSIIVLLAFAFGVPLALAASDVNQLQLTGSQEGGFIAPFMIPKGFPLIFNYTIRTEASIAIIDKQSGVEVQKFEFAAEGISIGEHKSFQLDSGNYTIRERYNISAIPDYELIKGQSIKGEEQGFEWDFTASERGTYDLSVSAVVTKLDLMVEGDLTLVEVGEIGTTIPIKLVTAKTILAGAEVVYTSGYNASLSKNSTVELVSSGEEEVATFVVTGAVKWNDETVIPDAEVKVELPAKQLEKTVMTDDGGIYKATFSGPMGTEFAKPGDMIKVTYNDQTNEYTVTSDDVAKSRAVVNMILMKELSIIAATIDLDVVKNGDTIYLTVVADPGLTVTADLSQLDSTKPDPVPIPELIKNVTGIYTSSVTIAENNLRENGLKIIVIAARDAFGNSATRDITVTLANETPPPEPPSIDGVSPSTKILEGDTTNVWALVSGDVTTVKAVITTPSNQTLAPLNLIGPEGDSHYETDIIGLTELGIYRVIIEATGPAGHDRSDEILIKTYPWDVNSDGVINIFDLVLVGKNFGFTVSGDDDPAWASDVNSDNIINILDLVIIAKHYEEQIAAAAPSLTAEPALIGRFEDGEIHLSEPVLALVIDGSSNFNYQKDGIAWIPCADRLIGVSLGNAFNSARIPLDASAADDIIAVTQNGRLLRVVLHRPERPARTEFLANYPNPFNPETWMPFVLSQEAEVSISIFSLDGRLIRRIDFGLLEPGKYVSRDRAAYWDGRTETGESAASGVYICRFKAGAITQQRRILLVK